LFIGGKEMAISGKAGEVDTGAAVAGIKSWTLDYTVDPLEITDFADSGVRAYVVGCSGWSGTFEGYKEGIPQAIAGPAITLKLLETQTANQLYQDEAFITGIHPSTSFDGVVSVSYDFQGTGALTVATA